MAGSNDNLPESESCKNHESVDLADYYNQLFNNKSQVKFGELFHKLFNVPLIIPQNGGALIEGCKITLPNGDIFEAVSYKGNIEEWRQQLEQGAKALNEELAGIDIDTELC